MKKLISCVVLVLAAETAVAGASFEKLNICWESPTERENGAALPANEIRGFKIYLKTKKGPVQVNTPAYPPKREFAAAARCFKYRVTNDEELCFTGFVVDQDGLESEVSEELCVTPVMIGSKPKGLVWRAQNQTTNKGK
jgi:hypothetical protein